jgi:ADP-ribosylglycohydrolase
MHRADHQRGILLGLAIGDALGPAVEFLPPGTVKPVTGYRGGGPRCHSSSFVGRANT